MFEKPQEKTENAPKADTVVGASVTLEGDFKSQGDVYVYGTVSGSIATTTHLTVGESAVVNAGLSAAKIVVSGSVTGNIQASESLVIARTGKVRGDITTKSLVIEEGAQFSGTSAMAGQQKEQRAGQQFSKPAK